MGEADRGDKQKDAISVCCLATSHQSCHRFFKVYVLVEAAVEVAVEVVLVVILVDSSSNSHQSCHRFFKVKRCDQQHLFPTKAGGALGSSHLTELEQERCWS